jgi:hypothetical protein
LPVLKTRGRKPATNRYAYTNARHDNRLKLVMKKKELATSEKAYRITRQAFL